MDGRIEAQRCAGRGLRLGVGVEVRHVVPGGGPVVHLVVRVDHRRDVRRRPVERQQGWRIAGE